MGRRAGTGSRSREGRPRKRSATISLNDALALVRQLLTNQQLDAAGELLRRIATATPDEPHVLHLSGSLLQQRGAASQARMLLERASRALPLDVDVWTDLGNTYASLELRDDAARAYRQAIEIAGSSKGAVGPLYNLAGLYIGHSPAESERLLRRALEIDADCAAAWNGLARALTAQDRLNESFEASCRATVLAPEGKSRELVGRALLHIGERDRALKHYRSWARDEPSNPVPRHHLKGLENPQTPEGAAHEYVEAAFDRFARTFEQKLASLEYRVPALVAEVMASIYPRAAGNLAILDAGCGTGLCGPLLRSYARRLVGVDLSTEMLDVARVKDCFDELIKGDLVACALDWPATFDLVVCADTLCYFAALEQPIAAIAAAMKPGGRFVFTLEAIDNENDHELRDSGRFAHSSRYLRRTLQGAGLLLLGIRQATLRMEALKPVTGWLIAAERAST